MTLIKSISGIRGTIGGRTGDTLNPLDIARFTSAFAMYIRLSRQADARRIVIGRDARISGEMVRSIVAGTLIGSGFDVLDIGLASTPTTELAVIFSKSSGGIIITASHNPKHWNALKLLNSSGEFLSKEEGEKVLDLAEKEDFDFSPVEELGHYYKDDSYDDKHINNILNLELVDQEEIKKKNFRVCLDTINSVGGIILPKLLKALGVDFEILNGEVNGDFAHNPEPLEKNLSAIMELTKQGGFDLGIVVDPDVDRLAFISEDGSMFGEEYTLVAVADYVLEHKVGNTVSNLSSSRALKDITLSHGGKYAAAKVGEVNVTKLMKKTSAIIGGEGNGGVIYPESHYGRDALVGIALFLSLMAKKNLKATEIRRLYPDYYIAKNRIELTKTTNFKKVQERIISMYPNEMLNLEDGLKIDFPDKWVHLRTSNTEPIIRIYSEASTKEKAEELGQEFINIINEIIG
ncbi:MAG: phosphoglucosamine mutase [Prevotella sp.]|nr:phosphoglucosamine mutase [Prevotella sp.]